MRAPAPTLPAAPRVPVRDPVRDTERTTLLGANAAVFFLFFGIALLDAVRAQAWISVAAWVALAILFGVAEARAARRSDG